MKHTSSPLAQSELDRVLSHCVLCGKCRAACPTYPLARSEARTARGRVALMRALLAGELQPTRRLIDDLGTCLLCGRCEAVCPAGVELTEALYGSRAALRLADRGHGPVRAAASLLLRSPRTGYALARVLRPLLRPILRARGLAADIPDRAFDARRRVVAPRGVRRGRVGVFMGCAALFLRPDLAEAMVSLLAGAGYEVVVPGEEACCGAPLRALGLADEARCMGGRNARMLGALDVEAIATLCPTCAMALKGYPETLHPVRDVSELLDGAAFTAVGLDGPVVYHDPCHLRYGMRVADAPRRLLRDAGAALVEPPRADCCGFGAALTYPTLAGDLAKERKADYARAATVVTSCPGCIAALGGAHPRVRHLIECLRSRP